MRFHNQNLGDKLMTNYIEEFHYLTVTLQGGYHEDAEEKISLYIPSLRVQVRNELVIEKLECSRMCILPYKKRRL